MTKKNPNDVNAPPTHLASPKGSADALGVGSDEQTSSVPKKKVLDASSGETSDNDADTPLNSDARSAAHTSDGNVAERSK
jgi:hypothetical protein